MSAHVLLQVISVPETSTADQAVLWSVIVVAQFVVREAFFRQEALATLLALIGFLMINPLMVLQLADPWEGLIAVSAPEAMIWAVRKLVFTHLMVSQQVGHLEGLATMRALIFCQQLHTLMSDTFM